jgi:tRNA G46 methylase TrmB
MKENEFNDLVFEKTNGVVQNGLFKNLKYSEKRERLYSKILGIYENQLQIFIKDAILKKPDLVINIGCGDGYYGLGLAKLLPNTKCILVDKNDKELDRSNKNALANNIQNADFMLDIDHEQLSALVANHNNPFIIIDIEGDEIQLLDTYKYKNLSKCTLLIECHDFMYNNITNLLVSRFASSHKIYMISDCEKYIMDEFLNEISLDDKLILQSEGRPDNMKWLYMTPR